MSTILCSNTKFGNLKGCQAENTNLINYLVILYMVCCLIICCHHSVIHDICLQAIHHRNSPSQRLVRESEGTSQKCQGCEDGCD